MLQEDDDEEVPVLVEEGLKDVLLVDAATDGATATVDDVVTLILSSPFCGY